MLISTNSWLCGQVGSFVTPHKKDSHSSTTQPNTALKKDSHPSTTHPNTVHKKKDSHPSTTQPNTAHTRDSDSCTTQPNSAYKKGLTLLRYPNAALKKDSHPSTTQPNTAHKKGLGHHMQGHARSKGQWSGYQLP